MTETTIALKSTRTQSRTQARQPLKSPDQRSPARPAVGATTGRARAIAASLPALVARDPCASARSRLDGLDALERAAGAQRNAQQIALAFGLEAGVLDALAKAVSAHKPGGRRQMAGAYALTLQSQAQTLRQAAPAARAGHQGRLRALDRQMLYLASLARAQAGPAGFAACKRL